MRLKEFRLFTVDDREPIERNNNIMAEFTAFINNLTKRRKVHTVTTWISTDKHAKGFCVWYN